MPHIDPRDWTPEHEERLRAALRAEAAKVRTDPGALGEIRSRTAKPPFWRSPVVVGLAGATALVGAMVVGTLTVLDRPGDDDLTAGQGVSPTVQEPSDTGAGAESSGGPDEQPTAPSDDSTAAGEAPGDDPTAAEDPSSTDGAAATFAGAMPVYYAVPAPSGELRLAREFHHVETTDHPVKVAVTQMFAEQPSDPDYLSLWTPTEVTSVDVADDAIVIDLAEVPAVEGPDADTPAVEAAVQQLVYTATAAAATLNQADGGKPVRVLVDGDRPADLHTVGLHMDLTRRSQLDIRQLVQINDPGEGAEVTSPVAVTGEAAAFEAALEWEIRDASDTVVGSGTAQADVCCEFSAFGFSVDLEPGTYTLSVSDTDVSDGEGPGPTSDTKTFSVVETASPASPTPTPGDAPADTPTPTGTPD